MDSRAINNNNNKNDKLTNSIIVRVSGQWPSGVYLNIFYDRGVILLLLAFRFHIQREIISENVCKPEMRNERNFKHGQEWKQ
jgi:hypothetical protein